MFGKLVSFFLLFLAPLKPLCFCSFSIVFKAKKKNALKLVLGENDLKIKRKPFQFFNNIDYSNNIE